MRNQRKYTKKQAVEDAALRLRVHARKTGQPVTRDMAFDAMATLRSDAPEISATDVLRLANRELKSNGEYHLMIANASRIS